MSKISRKDAAQYLALKVFPNEYEERAAINKVQAAFSTAIKTGKIQPPPWEQEVLMNWVSWMARRKKKVNPWRLVLAQITDLPLDPKPPKAKPEIGSITMPITINIVPGDLDSTRQELIKAWTRIRDLEQFERRYNKDVKNGKEGGRGNEK